MAMSMEQKLAKQMTEALCDIRFSPMTFASIIARGEPYAQRLVVQVFANLCELIAINYDYGNFEAVDLPYLKLCKEIANTIERQDEAL